jgi:hypothetical protein
MNRVNPAYIARRKSRANQSCAVFWLAEFFNSILKLRTGWIVVLRPAGQPLGNQGGHRRDGS